MQRSLHSQPSGRPHPQQRIGIGVGGIGSQRLAPVGFGAIGFGANGYGTVGVGPRAVDRRTYLASIQAGSIRGASDCGGGSGPSLADCVIGGYHVERQIGEGGCSVVYAASGIEDGRRVAIKIPKGDAVTASLRIKADFRASRRLRHPHVVRMHRLLPVADRFAAVMEWLDGPSLLEYVRGGLPAGQLPPLSRLLSVVAQLTSALAHIHAAGWVHGDVKPDNVHLTERGVARWLDFDLATPLNRPLWMPPPVHIGGTFAYLSPEAVTGDSVASPADMFSFGRLLARLICGRLPSWDPGRGTVASAIRIRQQLPRETPQMLLDLCTELVRAAPADRPSAAEVYQRITGEPLAVANADPWRRPEPPPHVQAAACQALHRADSGQGTMLVVETEQAEDFDLDGLIAATRSEEARLILSARCDAREHTRLNGFDAVFDQLAKWIGQLPEQLRAPWRDEVRGSLAATSPALAAALDIPLAEAASSDASRRPFARDEACQDLVRLLSAIAEERTVVLALHNLQDLDDASQRMLACLLHCMPSRPIVIVATALERGARWRRAETWSRGGSLPQRMTVRIGS